MRVKTTALAISLVAASALPAAAQTGFGPVPVHHAHAVGMPPVVVTPSERAQARADRQASNDRLAAAKETEKKARAEYEKDLADKARYEGMQGSARTPEQKAAYARALETATIRAEVARAAYEAASRRLAALVPGN